MNILSHVTQALEVNDIHIVLRSPEERMLMTNRLNNAKNDKHVSVTAESSTTVTLNMMHIYI